MSSLFTDRTGLMSQITLESKSRSDLPQSNLLLMLIVKNGSQVKNLQYFLFPMIG